MVQPRKEQIKSVDTKFSRFSFQVNAGDSFTDIPASTINPSLITQTPGGVEESVAATVLGTIQDPYPIVAGDSYSISVDGAAPITIILAGTDTTVGRIATNSFLSGCPALVIYENGALRFKSQTVGDNSSLVLADVVPGTLAKLGISAGTYLGSTAPVRGVTTKSPDLLGGFVPLMNSNGGDLVNDNPSLKNYFFFSSAMISAMIRTPEQPGGSKVHARLSQVGSNYRFSYYAFMAQKANVKTLGGHFDLLDGTDTLSLTIDLIPVSITFPAFPYTRNQIVDRINSVWSAIAPGGAFVQGVVSQPFSFVTDSIFVSVDGSAPYTVTFTTEVTVADVVNTINTTAGLSAVATASAVTVDDNIVLKISSNNTNNRLASIGLANPPNSTCLQKFGMTPGLYRASFIAEPYGNTEIKLSSLIRGPNSLVNVPNTNTPQTLSRMGLNGAPLVNGTDDLTEEAVVLPTLKGTGLTFFSPPPTYQITALVPETVEFGEVLADNDTSGHKYTNSGTTSNFDPRATNTFESTLFNNSGYSKGLQDIGKPVVIGPDGLIDPLYLQAGTAPIANLFKKFIRGDYSKGSVAALVASIIETPGTKGNPAAKSSSMIFDLDPDNSFPGNEFWGFRQAGDTLTTNFAFSIQTGSGGPSGATWRASGGPTTPFSYGSDGAVMNLHDVNTIAAGGIGMVPLTTTINNPPFIVNAGPPALGARVPRIWEQETPGLPLLSSVQARETVSCGDGVNSFGDFNGPDALYQAFAYFGTNTTFAQGKIILKGGVFTISTPLGGTLIVPTNRGITIQGWGPFVSIIQIAPGTVAPHIGTAGFSFIELRDLGVVKAAAPFGVIESVSGAEVSAKNCIFNNVTIDVNDGIYDLTDCAFNCSSATADLACLTVNATAGLTIGPYKAIDCVFNSGDNNPVLRITTGGSLTPVSYLRDFLFDRCEINLRSTTLTLTAGTTGNLVGNCGVVDLAPNGANSDMFQGAYVQNMTFRDCRVRANTAGGTNSILLHLIPQTNGTLFNGTEKLGFGKLEISGGSWICPPTDTLVNPFTAAGIGFDPAIFTGPSIGGVFLRDVLFGFDCTFSISPVKQGFFTLDINDVLWNGPGDSAPTQTFLSLSSAWLISADAIDISRVRFTGMTQAGGSGDMALKCTKLFINDLSFQDYRTGGAAGPPSARIWCRQNFPGGFGQGPMSINGVRFTGTDSSTQDWAVLPFVGTGAFFLLENNDQTTSGLPNRRPYGPYFFNNVTVNGFSFSGSSPISTALVRVNDFNWTAYTGAAQNFQGLSIKNCNISGMGPLFHYNSPADSHIHFLSNMVFEGNEVWGCVGISGGAAIEINNNNSNSSGSAFPGWDNIAIRRNYISNCAGLAVRLRQDYWYFVFITVTSTVDLSHNVMIDNNGALNAVQAFIGIMANVGSGLSLSGPNGVMYGNICSFGDQSLPGQIEMDNWFATLPNHGDLPTNIMLSATQNLMRGAWTAVQVGAVGTTLLENSYRYDSGVLMIHNQARLLSP